MHVTRCITVFGTSNRNHPCCNLGLRIVNGLPDVHRLVGCMLKILPCSAIPDEVSAIIIFYFLKMFMPSYESKISLTC
jgi:hypothetical protein